MLKSFHSFLSHSLPTPQGSLQVSDLSSVTYRLFSLLPVQEAPSFPGMLLHTPDICPRAICAGTLKPALASPAAGHSPFLTFFKANSGGFLYFGILPETFMLSCCVS